MDVNAEQLMLTIYFWNVVGFQQLRMQTIDEYKMPISHRL